MSGTQKMSLYYLWKPDGTEFAAGDLLDDEGNFMVSIQSGADDLATKLDALATNVAALTTAVGSVVCLDYPVAATPFATTNTGSAGAALTLTQADPGVGKNNYVLGYDVAIGAAANGSNDVTVYVESDAATAATKHWSDLIAAAAVRGTRVSMAFPKPIKCTAHKTADLVVSAPGGSAVIVASMTGYVL